MNLTYIRAHGQWRNTMPLPVDIMPTQTLCDEVARIPLCVRFVVVIHHQRVVGKNLKNKKFDMRKPKSERFLKSFDMGF